MKTKFLLMLLLALVAANARAGDTSLRVGAARVDETGPMGSSQSGKYDHERVYARAIVLDNGNARSALISYDGPERDFDMGATIKAVATIVNCPAANIIITHTHTHSATAAPMTFPGSAPGPTAPSAKILEAVKQARANLQPARMAYDTGMLYLNVNRDAIDPSTRKWTQGTNLEGPSDKTVAVLEFVKPDGSPIAIYVTYAMHPIDGYVLGVVTGDFPEAMSRYVERTFGDHPVVAFAQAPSGDQNPLYLRPSTNAMATRAGNPITGLQMNRETSEAPLRLSDAAAVEHKDKAAPAADPKAIDALFRFIESEGQVFGEEVIRVLSSMKNSTDQVRISGAHTIVSCPGRHRTNGSPFDPSTREGMKGTYEDAAPVNLQVGMLGLGTVALASINGEAYTLIGSRIKQEAPMKNTMIATLANERVPGYIPDDSAYGHETFQVLDSTLKPGCAERGIADAVVAMEADYLNAR
jgi:neutral ceramidase